MNALHFIQRRALLLVLSLLALGLLLVGCGSTITTPASTTPAPAALTGSFVGKIASTQAYIGLVSDGKEAMAYICDGTPAGVSLLSWFKGPVNGNHADLTTAKHDHLVATLTPTAASGTIQLSDGRALSFTAQLVTGDAGLYRANQTASGVTVVAGWVLLSDGTQRGGFAKKGQIVDAPSLTPSNLHVTLADGTTLAVQQVTPEYVHAQSSGGVSG